MRNFKTLLLFAISIVFIQSCGDPCDDINIPAGYDCVDGQLVLVDACANVTCPAGYVCVDGNCELEGVEIVTKAGFIDADETWTSDKIYKLVGKVVVSSGATLTIDPGTIIKGEEGTGTLASALVIAQGAKVMAMGTADNPIIMTSVIDDIVPGQQFGSNLDEKNSALWGGFIILGKAPISVSDNSGIAQIEGFPADDAFGQYGGTDPADNSGEIHYVSVRHGGATIGDGNDINGITFGGVGNTTVVDHIEVVGNLDDGIELFGGTVNVSNVVIWAADDDAIDIDQAYSGTIDNAVVIALGTDHCLEIDGPEGNATGNFTVQNLTIKGDDQELGQYRDGATGTTSNAYFFGFTTIAGGEGDLSLSKDDNGAYTTDINDLTFNNIEVVLTPDATDLSDMVKDGITATQVTEGANTVGADTSVFGWSFTSLKGALNF